MKRAADSQVGVFLRELSLADCSEFLPAMSASQVLHAGRVKVPSSEAEYRAFFSWSRLDNARVLLLCRGVDGRIAGVFTIGEILRGPFQSACAGCYAVANYAHQGHMTAGTHLLIRYAFAKLKLHRLEAYAEVDNNPAKALLRRCGFEAEGISRRYLKVRKRWRDHERWSLTVEDWRRQLQQ